MVPYNLTLHGTPDWIPLYVFADLNCKLNTQQHLDNKVHLDLTEDQYNQLTKKS